MAPVFFPTSIKHPPPAVKLINDGEGLPRHPLVRAEAIEYALGNPLVPQRIADSLRDTRFVVALREPVSRMLSQFNFHWQATNLGGVCMLGADCSGMLCCNVPVVKGKHCHCARLVGPR